MLKILPIILFHNSLEIVPLFPIVFLSHLVKKNYFEDAGLRKSVVTDTNSPNGCIVEHTHSTYSTLSLVVLQHLIESLYIVL